MRIEDLLGTTTGSMLNVQNLNVIVAPEDKKNLDGQIVVIPTDGQGGMDKDVVNPGIEYGDDGRAKWSPPLQQQLSVIKGAVGTTTDDTTVEPTNLEKDELVAARNDTGSNSNSAVAAVNADIESNESDILKRLKELAAVAVKNTKSSSTNNVAKFLTRNFPSE
jgi:PKD repeat protein